MKTASGSGTEEAPTGPQDHPELPQPVRPSKAGTDARFPRGMCAVNLMDKRVNTYALGPSDFQMLPRRGP